MEQAKRNAIAELQRAGHTPAYIAKVLKYPRMTVYDVCNKYDRSCDVSRAPHKPRRDRKLTPRFLNGLKRSIKANPTIPMTILAQKRGFNRRTIERGLVKLKLTSYVQGKRHLLTGRMKGIRLHRCKRLISWMKDNGGVMKFFSDEKNFTVDCAFNRRNDRWIASSSSEVQRKMTTKLPAKVMTLCVVSTEGDTLTHFFEPRKKVNAATYCEVLTTKMIPWMKDKSNGKSFLFQQDSSTGHTAKKTVDLLQSSKIKF